MSTKYDGGYAFPFSHFQTPDGMCATTTEYGMSLRDWFAGQAMLPTFLLSLEAVKSGGDANISERDLAEGAYAFADAMLAEREK